MIFTENCTNPKKHFTSTSTYTASLHVMYEYHRLTVANLYSGTINSTQRVTTDAGVNTSMSVSKWLYQVKNYVSYTSYTDLSPVPVRSALKSYFTSYIFGYKTKFQHFQDSKTFKDIVVTLCYKICSWINTDINIFITYSDTQRASDCCVVRCVGDSNRQHC